MHQKESTDLDALNRRPARAINDDGRIYLTQTTYRRQLRPSGFRSASSIPPRMMPELHLRLGHCRIISARTPI